MNGKAFCGEHWGISCGMQLMRGCNRWQHFHTPPLYHQLLHYNTKLVRVRKEWKMQIGCKGLIMVVFYTLPASWWRLSTWDWRYYNWQKRSPLITHLLNWVLLIPLAVVMSCESSLPRSSVYSFCSGSVWCDVAHVLSVLPFLHNTPQKCFIKISLVISCLNEY